MTLVTNEDTTLVPGASAGENTKEIYGKAIGLSAVPSS